MTKCAVRFIITITNKRFERQLIVYEKADGNSNGSLFIIQRLRVRYGIRSSSRWAEDDEDVRAVIYRICEANGLQNTDLQPGQKIMVPVRVHAGDGVMLAEATNGNL